MRSEIVARNYAQLWPSVVATKFKTAEDRDRAAAILSRYVGAEPDRVRLGILKAANCDLDTMERLLHLALLDWRDLLVRAEYPLSSKGYRRSADAPGKYDELLTKEQDQYEAWLRSVLEA